MNGFEAGKTIVFTGFLFQNAEVKGFTEQNSSAYGEFELTVLNVSNGIVTFMPDNRGNSYSAPVELLKIQSGTSEEMTELDQAIGELANTVKRITNGRIPTPEEKAMILDRLKAQHSLPMTFKIRGSGSSH